ncbi:eryA [Symbiodinium sp. CCMP2592]|nr:eryA [Symbiodinium sp. CCMP2592]
MAFPDQSLGQAVCQAATSGLKSVHAQKPLTGVVHAAGVLDDHLIADLTRNHFANVFKPKVDGSVKGPQHFLIDSNLQKSFFNLGLETTDSSKVDFFVLFSSVAAMLGSRGQANYCAANTFLDSFALHRCGQGLPAVSVQWGPWAEVGMAARAGTRESGGYLRLDPNASLQARKFPALGAALAATPSPGGVLGISRIDWSSFLAVQRKVPCFLTNFKHLKKAAAASLPTILLGGQELISSTIIDALRSVIGDPDWTDFSVPFMDMGLDSLSVVEFRNLIQASFDGVHLASTVIFDFPTVTELTGFISARLSGDDSKDDESVPDVRDFNVSESVAIAGCAARFAGCSGNSPDESASQYWAMLKAGLDMITTVPSERWDIDLYFDPDPSEPGKMQLWDQTVGMRFSELRAVQLLAVDGHQASSQGTHVLAVSSAVWRLDRFLSKRACLEWNVI